ncbi:MAG: radical SAM protein [Desulfuromonas sp.]|nr:MAG: radical SAM protein [Desulfuromonas sp.]
MSSLPPLIDTHAHLDSSQYHEDLDAVLLRAQENGISNIITIGCDLPSSKKSVALAESIPGLYAAVGVHPHDASTVDAACLREIGQLAGSDKVVAVGEIGLDYYRDRSPRETQRKVFSQQIELAKEMNLPIIVHDRDAHFDVIDIMGQSGAEDVGGILHCFSGDLDMARKCIDLGFLISFAGPLTYPKNDQLRDIARQIPTEHLLVETDCPYLAPQKFRGKRNEPAYVRHTAEKLAEIKGLSMEDISRIVQLNCQRLFGIGRIDQSTKIAYKIRNSLYLNVTNRCTNQCVFCAKRNDFFVKGHQLRLESEPSAAEVISAIGEPSVYDEIVFCGYGEPLLRLDLVIEVAAWLKKKGCRVRINTDGLANLVHQRNILPDLTGLVDVISVSLNAADPATYQHWCQSTIGEEAFDGVVSFLELAKDQVPTVIATAVTLPEVDMRACRALADRIGVEFRERPYNEVG